MTVDYKYSCATS